VNERGDRREVRPPVADGSRRAGSATRPHERMLARRVAVARASGRRRLRVFITGVVVVGASAGAFGLAHSSLFSARTVRVTGAVHTTRAAILAVSALDRAPPLIDVNAIADAHAIERLPWIKTASVVVSFPSSVAVSVTERRAVAAVRLAGRGFALVDATGRVLADAAARPAGIVLVGGLTPLPSPGGSVRGAAGVLATAAALPVSLVGRITVLRFQRGLGIIAELGSSAQVILGTTADLSAKFVALATVLNDVSTEGIATIDLRAPSDPVLTP